MLATAILHACGAGTTSAVTGGGGGPSGLPLAVGPLATSLIAMTILCAGIVTLVLIVALSRRPVTAPVAVPVGATISPDGFYWWDGTAWRPTR